MYILMFLDTCPYSHAAKALLEEKNLEYQIVIFTNNLSTKSKKQYISVLEKDYLVDKNSEGHTVFEKSIFKDFFGVNSTFPRVYNDKKLIGGYDNLRDKLA